MRHYLRLKSKFANVVLALYTMLKVFRFFRQLQSAVWVQIQRARVGTGNIRRDGIPEGFFIFCLFREMPEKTDLLSGEFECIWCLVEMKESSEKQHRHVTD
jgi:hypothetical protein